MAYCNVADVIARAGRFGAAWTDSSTPSVDDLELFCRARAAEIDAALIGRGITAPATGVPAEALRSLNAAGALVLALGASALGSASEAVSGLLERVQKEWDEGLSAVRTGSLAAVTALEVEQGEAAGANDFWSEEPGYGLEGWVDPETNPYLAPEIARGQSF